MQKVSPEGRPLGKFPVGADFSKRRVMDDESGQKEKQHHRLLSQSIQNGQRGSVQKVRVVQQNQRGGEASNGFKPDQSPLPC